MSDESKAGFWSSLPGVLTAIAALITAGTGAFLALRQPGPDPGPQVSRQETAPPREQPSAAPTTPAQGPASTPTAGPDRFTGPMGALEAGISYSGGDLYDRQVSSAEECVTLCANDDRCRAVTFIISQQRCWVKGSINPPQPSGDMVSARKND